MTNGERFALRVIGGGLLWLGACLLVAYIVNDRIAAFVTGLILGAAGIYLREAARL